MLADAKKDAKYLNYLIKICISKKSFIIITKIADVYYLAHLIVFFIIIIIIIECSLISEISRTTII